MLDKKNFYINGKWVSPKNSKEIEVIDPSTEKSCAVISLGDANDVNAAVNAAKNAFDSWSFTTKEKKIELLEKLYAVYKKRWAEIADAITLEMGAPKDFSSQLQTGTGASHIKSFTRYLKEFNFEKVLGDHAKNQKILYEPKGVCALITPWNWPMNQVCLKVIPALAAGCTMILKPSKEAPLSAFILADILDEIGLPAGVFNLVSGHGSEIGNYMSSHPDVDMVSFTGSTGAGVSVSQSAAPTIKRVTLELGGKSANVALDDSDPILVAKKAIGACHQNSGQTCSALTRLIIPEEMNEQICEIIAAKNDSYLVGNPLDETTRCGPMVSSRQQSSVTEYIQSGINEGATLISGGLGVPDGVDKGFYVKPTIFANVTPNMRIWKEEIFGPVLVITTYKNESEALSLANDSIYGLSGGVWSASNERAIEFAKKMRTGQVSINGGAFNVSAPFGGYKLSGNGRELGTHGLDEFLEIKSIQM